MLECSKIKICIFDFDGTLVDTMSHFADLASSLIHSHYHVSQEQARRLYLESSGLPFSRQLEVLFPGNQKNACTAREFEKQKQESFFAASLTAETQDVLSQLRGRGLKLAISSGNYAQLIEEFLQAVPIHFEYILGFDPGCAKGKGHFEYIQDHEHCSKDNMLFIADSLHDMRQSLESQVPFIAKLGTFQKEDFQKLHPNVHAIHNLHELLEFLT